MQWNLGSNTLGTREVVLMPSPDEQCNSGTVFLPEQPLGSYGRTAGAAGSSGRGGGWEPQRALRCGSDCRWHRMGRAHISVKGKTGYKIAQKRQGVYLALHFLSKNKTKRIYTVPQNELPLFSSISNCLDLSVPSLYSHNHCVLRSLIKNLCVPQCLARFCWHICSRRAADPSPLPQGMAAPRGRAHRLYSPLPAQPRTPPAPAAPRPRSARTPAPPSRCPRDAPGARCAALPIRKAYLSAAIRYTDTSSPALGTGEGNGCWKLSGEPERGLPCVLRCSSVGILLPQRVLSSDVVLELAFTTLSSSSDSGRKSHFTNPVGDNVNNNIHQRMQTHRWNEIFF